MTDSQTGKKHLLFFTNLFPTKTDPERGIFKYQLASYLADDWKITVICPLPWFPAIPAFRLFEKWYQYADVPFYQQRGKLDIYYPKYFIIPKISEAWQASSMKLRCQSLVKKIHLDNPIDIINSHWLYPDGVAIQNIATQLNIPHVPTGSGCDINDFLQHNNKRAKILAMLRECSHINVVSSALKYKLIAEGFEEERITAITNGVNVKQFSYDKNGHENRKEFALPEEGKILLYLGRLSEEKNVSALLSAFNSIAATHEEINLVIAGDGPEITRLQSMATPGGHEHRIHIVGKISYERVSKLMNCADYFCLPSIREGCPNVLLEALACGLPCIASNVGAIPDLLSEETGLMFNPKDTADIAAQLSKAFSTDWDREIIAESVSLFSWKATAKNYSDVFTAIIE